MTTRGVTYLLRNKLYIDFCSKSLGVPLVLQRGTSFEMPKESDFVQAGTKEREEMNDPTPLQVYQAIGKMYDTGYDSSGTREDELNGIVFAGYGDPLLRFDELIETTAGILTARPGAPVRMNTLGLVDKSRAHNVANELKDVGMESVSVAIAADNPVLYEELVKPTKYTFQDVCAFVVACVECGLPIECTAVAHPKVNLNNVKNMSEALGASFRSRSYHP